MHFLSSAHTSDVFVVSRDILMLGVPDSFGADEGSDPLCVFVVAEHPAIAAHYSRVDVGIHFGIDEGDIIKQVVTLILDCFDWGWAAAEHSYYKEKKRARI